MGAVERGTVGDADGEASVTRVEQIGDCTLYLGDAALIVPMLPSVDACVTDPPYGIGENDRKVASRGKLARPVDYGAGIVQIPA